MMNRTALEKLLRDNGLTDGNEIGLIPLEGGVSSDIFLISNGTNRFVLKMAREKLKVKDDWFSDAQRNRTEHRFAEYLLKQLPGAVPEILFADDKQNFFAMEYLNPELFKNWKQQLLSGDAQDLAIIKAAELLADIHRLTHRSDEAEALFRDKQYFKTLRTDPYLITTGKRHPEFGEIFFEEAERLNRWSESLIHGDFSPKNILVGEQRVVLLDHEVACFGDPAFRSGFSAESPSFENALAQRPASAVQECGTHVLAKVCRKDARQMV
jgi:5-methylthioribose kinase